jgi:hypothetical protein
VVQVAVVQRLLQTVVLELQDKDSLVVVVVTLRLTLQQAAAVVVQVQLVFQALPMLLAMVEQVLLSTLLEHR